MDAILARARAVVDSHPPAKAGEDGHGTLFRLCLSLVKGLCFGVENSYRLILAEYNPRCDPPWSEDELRHKCEDADASTEAPDGFLLDGKGKRRVKKGRGPCKPWLLHSAVPNAPLNLYIPGSWRYRDGGMTRSEDGS